MREVEGLSLFSYGCVFSSACFASLRSAVRFVFRERTSFLLCLKSFGSKEYSTGAEGSVNRFFFLRTRGLPFVNETTTSKF